jgi:hypothetical protein
MVNGMGQCLQRSRWQAEAEQRIPASWIGPQGKVLYLPIALRGMRPYESCLEWITTTFAPLTVI